MTLAPRLPTALVLAIVLALGASPALAHTGQGEAHGLAQGFLHPLMGLDHLLAMVGVGLLAARIGGRAVVLVPAAFLAMMALGGAMGAAGFVMPMVEIAIAVSVAVLGAILMLRSALPVAVAMAVVGGFALFHGHAHGAEMPDAAGGIVYGLGFLAATALLHATGLGLGFAAGGANRLRYAGAGLAVAGLGLLAGAF
ncbi:MULTISPECIES: HupE/UreJ family protein [unclassified Methylobacterium]|uniref:HupE/UreJ family protein n=1 Tax=unclassified Methylobacterium TaxID=2615210 RepID=UPI0006FD1CCF|nr:MULTISPECIES: HupE/UreJ family protein [unclassified Methylobacterium]KQP61510.1 urease accessory protein [Methylobacterium sp. Leaf108]KQT80713.1 urease accessory protein [Methylobacterium sp. Leaf466]